MTELLSDISGLVWGTPMLIFLVIANIILIFYSKFIPLKGFVHSYKLIFGKIHHEGDSTAEGQISHFQTLCTALAATIGMGNISGVAVAIYTGGAGAVFWMWIAAFLGMNTKFFECSLAVMFRGKDYTGETQGGPMYFIQEGMGAKYKILAILFSVFGLIGTYSLFQVNQMSEFIFSNYGVHQAISGICFALAVGYILMGGLKRIAAISSSLVPLMSVLYFVLCVGILLINYEKVPGMFTRIFYEALTGNSIMGGALGYSILHMIQTGVKRAAFSNEAGVGTAPLAHGNAKTAEPISEGYVAMQGPFLDTIMVCTLTALVILVSGSAETSNANGINMTTHAFVSNFGEFGRHALGMIIFLFSFSTMIGMAYYNKKCWDYLFAGKKGLGKKTFIAFYSGSLIFGALAEMTNVVNFIDICFGLMAIPNIIATVFLAKKVQTALNSYNQKYKI